MQLLFQYTGYLFSVVVFTMRFLFMGHWQQSLIQLYLAPFSIG